MLNNFLKKFLFLMISSLLVSCASQKSMAPLNAAEVHPKLYLAQPDQKIDNPVTEKQIAVSEAEPVPENVAITLNVQFDTGKANIKPEYHMNWYSDCGHLEKSGIRNKFLEVRNDSKAKELYETI